MRQEGIWQIAKTYPLIYRIPETRNENRRFSSNALQKLERYILNHIPDESLQTSYKQLNDNATNSGINTSKEKDIRTLLYFLCVKGYVKKEEDASHNITISRQTRFRFNHQTV